MNQKVLIITGLNEKLNSLFPLITNKNKEDLIIINSFGSVISQSYGCIIRNIVMNVFYNDIEEIYVIGDKSNQEPSISETELLNKIEALGISKDVLQTIDYIDVIKDDSVVNWLIGPENTEITVQKNIEIIKQHPLMPKSVSVYGFVANPETSDFEAVS